VLAGMGDEQVAEPLVRLLEHSDPDSVSTVVEAIGMIGGTRTVELLINLLEDMKNSPWVRFCAALALGETRDSRAASALNKAMKDPDKDVRSAARNSHKLLHSKP